MEHKDLLDNHSPFRNPRLVCESDNLLSLVYGDPGVGESGSGLKYNQVIEAIDEDEVGEIFLL